MIKHYKDGANISILNTEYHRGNYKENDENDYLTIVYKDLDTGLKYKEEIKNPTYEYYIAKPDKRVSYPRMYIDKDDVDKVTCKFKDLEKDIATHLGKRALEFFYDNLRTKNARDNKKLHMEPDIFNSDMNIEDNYRFRFDKKYVNSSYNPTKAFFDIEVDGINAVGDFAQPGECPINAISSIFDKEKQINVFLLRTKGNALIDEFYNTLANKETGPVLMKELKDFLYNAVDAEDNPKYRPLMDFNIVFRFYDEDKEINLISDFFKTVNTFKPDYIMAWNAGFDIPYIIARIEQLGVNPRDIMCHPDFENKVAYYFVDEEHKGDFAERTDFGQISSYTVYLDQLIQFASIRKGRTKFKSYKLDDIGSVIAKVRKLDYKHITTDIKQLPYLDYKTFVFYNIMDTVVQYCIEAVCGDIDYTSMKSIMNNTRQSKVHRQTVYLTNRAIKEFYKLGYIMGNNVNKFNTKPNEKYSGAFVADPMKVSDDNKIKIYGNPIDVVDNAIDSDFSSLYPSIIREFLIMSYNMIGKVEFDNDFADYYLSRSIIPTACKYFNLAGYTELYNEVINFFTHIMKPQYGLKYNSAEEFAFENTPKLINVMEFFGENKVINKTIVDGKVKPELIEPMIFMKKPKEDLINPMEIGLVSHEKLNKIEIGKIDQEYIENKKDPDYDKWKEFRDYATATPNQQFINSKTNL